MDIQRLVAEIELDVQDVKFLSDAFMRNPDEAGRRVLKRSVEHAQGQLAELLSTLETALIKKPVAEESEEVKLVEVKTPKQPEILKEPKEPEMNIASAPILAERIKPVADLKRSISLNDTFRFSLELFAGDTERMNTVLQCLSEQASLDDALTFLGQEVQVDPENEALVDLQELLTKYFQ